MTTIFERPEALLGAVGQHLGHSEWLEIDQQRINLFADATGDHQWIHVDAQRAAQGPFGKTIAHGYLTLSLASLFLPQVMQVNNVSMGVNYGCEKVRFPAPVPVGSRVRGGGELVAAEEVKGGVQVIVRMTIEIEGEDRPGCVIDTISRFYPKTAVE
jgi:acyl dehydratase